VYKVDGLVCLDQFSTETRSPGEVKVIRSPNEYPPFTASIWVESGSVTPDQLVVGVEVSDHVIQLSTPFRTQTIPHYLDIMQLTSQYHASPCLASTLTSLTCAWHRQGFLPV
jgi:hypothetical protein